ncbi:MAG: phosphopantetheine-binding protein [Steroidobacteraceae bacterium]
MNVMSECAHQRPEPTTRERLLKLVRQILGPPAASRPLPIDARLNDLGISSLKMVNLMLSVESEFDIAIAQTDINPDNFASLGSVEALIVRSLATRATP